MAELQWRKPYTKTRAQHGDTIINSSTAAPSSYRRKMIIFHRPRLLSCISLAAFHGSQTGQATGGRPWDGIGAAMGSWDLTGYAMACILSEHFPRSYLRWVNTAGCLSQATTELTLSWCNTRGTSWVIPWDTRLYPMEDLAGYAMGPFYCFLLARKYIYASCTAVR